MGEIPTNQAVYIVSLARHIRNFLPPKAVSQVLPKLFILSASLGIYETSCLSTMSHDHADHLTFTVTLSVLSASLGIYETSCLSTMSHDCTDEPPLPHQTGISGSARISTTTYTLSPVSPQL